MLSRDVVHAGAALQVVRRDGTPVLVLDKRGIEEGQWVFWIKMVR